MGKSTIHGWVSIAMFEYGMVYLWCILMSYYCPINMPPFSRLNHAFSGGWPPSTCISLAKEVAADFLAMLCEHIEEQRLGLGGKFRHNHENMLISPRKTCDIIGYNRHLMGIIGNILDISWNLVTAAWHVGLFLESLKSTRSMMCGWPSGSLSRNGQFCYRLNTIPSGNLS